MWSAHSNDTQHRITYSIDTEVLTVEPLSSRAGNKSNSRSDIFRETKTTIGVLLGDEVDDLLRLAGAEEGSIDRSWRDGVDGNTTTAKVLGKNASDLLNSPL